MKKTEYVKNRDQYNLSKKKNNVSVCECGRLYTTITKKGGFFHVATVHNCCNNCRITVDLVILKIKKFKSIKRAAKSLHVSIDSLNDFIINLGLVDLVCLIVNDFGNENRNSIETNPTKSTEINIQKSTYKNQKSERVRASNDRTTSILHLF